MESLSPDCKSCIKISAKPFSKDTYAIFFLSGDQSGDIIGALEVKRICSFLPSMSEMHI